MLYAVRSAITATAELLVKPCYVAFDRFIIAYQISNLIGT